MEETKVFDQPGTMETANGEEMHIDNKVLNNPDWVEVSEAAKLILKGDRQTRNIADKEKWEKRYGRVRGLPRLHYPRNSVMEYIKVHGPHDVLAARAPAAESTTGTAAPANQEESTINPPQALSQFNGFLEIHKNVVSENNSLRQENVKVEKEVTLWKTSFFWMIAVAIIGVGGIGISWFISQKSQTIQISSLSTQVSSKDNELSQTKDNLLKAQTELETLKSTMKLPANSAGGANDTNK